jgi:putative transposase
MARPVGTAPELESRRRRAVERLARGEPLAVIARELGVNLSSLYRWRKMATDGPAGLAAKPQPHAAPRLNDHQLDELLVLLDQGAAAHGWPDRYWTNARVAQLIRRHFGVAFHPDHVGRLLRHRLGWTTQQANRELQLRAAFEGSSPGSHATSQPA